MQFRWIRVLAAAAAVCALAATGRASSATPAHNHIILENRYTISNPPRVGTISTEVYQRMRSFVILLSRKDLSAMRTIDRFCL